MHTQHTSRSAFGPLLQGLIFAFLATGHLWLVVWLMERPNEGDHSLLGALVFIASVGMFRHFDFFQDWNFGRGGSMGNRILVTWGLLATGLIVIGFLTKQTEEYSRLVMIVWLVTTPMVFAVIHLIARYGLLNFFPQLVPQRSAVIVFVNPSAERLAGILRALEMPRFNVLGFFEDREPERLDEPLAERPILGAVSDLADYVNHHHVDVVFVVLPMQGSDRVLRVAEQLGDTTASIYYVPDFRTFDMSHMRFSELGGLPVLTLTETPFFGADGWFKRCMDILFASLVLIVLSPLFALVALGILLTMGRPIFFTQTRYGLDGRQISVHKFRTMRPHDDSDHVHQATREDPRVTPLGRFLRRTSIDEWPQFWNVLTGEMSVVGPRPHAVIHNEQYRRLIRRYMVRHKVRPGLTGWAQVHGLRGETRDLSDMERRVRYDLDYIQNWSPELDMRIILSTLWLVFRDHEAY